MLVFISLMISCAVGYGICAMMVIAKEYDEAMARDMANIIMKSRNKL